MCALAEVVVTVISYSTYLMSCNVVAIATLVTIGKSQAIERRGENAMRRECRHASPGGAKTQQGGAAAAGAARGAERSMAWTTGALERWARVLAVHPRGTVVGAPRRWPKPVVP